MPEKLKLFIANKKNIQEITLSKYAS
jgi:hypothetical protein